MDEEIRRCLRVIVRGGPDAIRAAIKDLERNLTEYRVQCPTSFAHNSPQETLQIQHVAYGREILRIEGDFLECQSCGILVGTSIFSCRCQPPMGPSSAHTYMIGDRDAMRIRCRYCHGLIPELTDAPLRQTT